MKGISPIIASVLLIAFTVAVGGILSVWSTTLTTTQTQTVSNQTSGQVVCSPSLVINEAKVPTANTSVINVTYSNLGNQQISGVKLWVRTTFGMYSVSGTTLAAGESAVTGLTLIGSATTNSSDLIRVTGTCGGVVTVSAECTPADKCWKAV